MTRQVHGAAAEGLNCAVQSPGTAATTPRPPHRLLSAGCIPPQQGKRCRPREAQAAAAGSMEPGWEAKQPQAGLRDNGELHGGPCSKAGIAIPG